MDITTIEFPCLAAFVSAVRQLAGSLFEMSKRGDDAKLITSELVTNSVRHSRSRHGGTVTVRFSIGENHGRIDVLDDGPDAEPIPAAEADEHRRGLRFIVDSCADKWGQETEGGQSIYWAELHWN